MHKEKNPNQKKMQRQTSKKNALSINSKEIMS